VNQLVEDLIRPIGGPIGIWLRRFWYSRRLRGCGSNLNVGPGVYLDNPQYMSFGDWVCLDREVIITAGPAGRESHTKLVTNPNCKAQPGEVIIGSRCHVAVGCLIQGHGGVSIGDDFTASARTMIYSLSNCPYGNRAGQVETAEHSVERVRTPVGIGRNVWLGLNVIVVGNTIGDDAFVHPFSLVTSDIPANVVAGGSPAAPKRQRLASAAGTRPE
jgi:acetyltransferase-like isoleucine patch superfamily enzyme